MVNSITIVGTVTNEATNIRFVYLVKFQYNKGNCKKLEYVHITHMIHNNTYNLISTIRYSIPNI